MSSGKTEHNEYVTNNDVYNGLIVKVEALQAPLDEAAKYVDAYILTDACGVDALQARIDRLISDLETKRYKGGLDNAYKTTAENECKEYHDFYRKRLSIGQYERTGSNTGRIQCIAGRLCRRTE